MPFSELALLRAFPFRATVPLLVDVGAHQGGFSAAFARRGWSVLAFEPERENRAAWQRALAAFPTATCLPLAVSDVDGEHLPFYVSAEHYGIHALRPFHPSHRPAYEVETVRLATALRDHAAPPVTLLKLDVEGADLLALRGFDFAAQRPELVMAEYMDERSLPTYGYTHHAMAALLAAHGYTIYLSMWAPITSYARAGEAGEPHSWLGLRRYPLPHASAWGNLIAVPAGREPALEGALRRCLLRTRLVDAARRLPGASRAAQLLRGRR